MAMAMASMDGLNKCGDVGRGGGRRPIRKQNDLPNPPLPMKWCFFVTANLEGLKKGGGGGGAALPTCKKHDPHSLP